jgi:iron complex transport system ATP-binding protein
VSRSNGGADGAERLAAIRRADGHRSSPGQISPTHADAPLLAANALGLRAGGYPDGRWLFERLGFEVREGECWVVLGPNGSGKSSLLAALAGVFDRSAGDVAVDGKTLDDWKPGALAERRAWCPQFWSDPFPSSVLDTVQLARHRHEAWFFETQAPDDAVRALMARLELADLASVDVRILSGGERQRVAIATALLQEAPVLLLDEPASHLDLGHQQLLVDVLRGHAAKGGAGRRQLARPEPRLGSGRPGRAARRPRWRHGRAARNDDDADPPRRAFGVAIQQVAVGSQQRFWSGLRPAEPIP